MATRSRTLLFLQYRNTFSRTGRPRSNGPSFDTSEASGLLGESRPGKDGGEVVVELATLPPRWIDVVEETEEEMEKIKSKISELEGLQKKNVLPGFEDQSSDELSMDRLTDEITALFHSCQRKVKRINAESQQSSRSQQNAVLSKNIQTSLATKLQELSGSFRKTQSKYLQKLRGREARNKPMFTSNAGDMNDGDDDELDAVFSDAQMQAMASNERAITEREKEINEIVKSINGLAAVFKELQTMVIDQGTILDRIDYNIEQVNVHVEDAHGELQKAYKMQNNKLGKYCIIVLAVILFIMILVVVFKHKTATPTTNTSSSSFMNSTCSQAANSTASNSTITNCTNSNSSISTSSNTTQTHQFQLLQTPHQKQQHH